MALNDNAKAEMTYWKLVERNPENIIYYHRIEKCRGLGISSFHYVHDSILTFLNIYA